MKIVSVLLLVSFAVAAYGLPTRIVGGDDAPIGKYPYQVSLRENGELWCGGSIINNRYILTAAHCLVGSQVLTVHTGTNFLNETGNVYQTEKKIIHEKFNGFSLHNDIGLIRVNSDLQYSETVKPINLRTERFVATGYPTDLTGWGRLSYGGVIPNALQELHPLVISQEACAKSSWMVKTTNICTLLKAGHGACHGDSGGPLVADGQLIGIVSFGNPCAVGSPDVFTRVSSYIDWINEHLE